MAVTIRPDGSFEVEYIGPYGGLNVQMPENLIKDTESPALNDVILRNAEIRSRPSYNSGFLSSPNSGFAQGAIGVVNGKIWSVGSTGVARFNFTTGTWTFDNSVFAFAPGFSGGINWRVFNNKVYAVNGTQHLASWDGLGAFTLDNATAGGNNIGAFFIDELDNHLIIANTIEGASTFGQRVRWSASGLPSVWDPTVNINAGQNDFVEVPDQITGLMMLGRVGYIFRTDGITEVAPTGRGVAPFDFNHLWASQYGIGNGLFYAIAQYGTMGVFVSRDNIYAIQAFQIQPIGGSARDAIFTDLSQANQAIGPFNNMAVLGSIMPTVDFDYALSTMIPAGSTSAPTVVLPYLAYYLTIPLPTGTKIWVYSFEDQNWTNFFLPGITVTGRQSIILQQAAPANSPQTPVTAFPALVTGPTLSTIATLQGAIFNDATQGSSYSYKIEDIATNRVPTVRRVILTYRDLGVATITVTLTGTDDNAKVQSITSPPITIGNTNPTKTLMTKFVDIQLTTFRPQLSWNRAANGGPVSITKAVMIGQVEKEVTL